MEILKSIIDQSLFIYNMFVDQNGYPLNNTTLFIPIDGNASYVELNKHKAAYVVSVGDVYLDFKNSTFYLESPFDKFEVSAKEFINLKKKFEKYETFDRYCIGEIKDSLLPNPPDFLEFDERQ